MMHDKHWADRTFAFVIAMKIGLRCLDFVQTAKRSINADILAGTLTSLIAGPRISHLCVAPPHVRIDRRG